MKKHTPGPWEAVEGSHGSEYCTVFGRERGVAVVCDLDHYVKGESKANACLIAAAPEILEALEGILKLSHLIRMPATHDGLQICDALVAARAAVAKATKEATK